MADGSNRRGFLRILSTGLTSLFASAARAWTSPAQRRPLPPVTTAPPAAVAAARTVKLSDAAAEMPLPEKSWLNFFRNFMTRSGSWRGHPTEARPLARREGRIAVVGGDRAPVGEMLGFGNIRDAGDGVTCSTNVCDSLGATARTTCNSRSCGSNSCSDLKCDIDQCGSQKCASHSCTSHSSRIADLVAELKANWDTQLVRELRVQFGTDSMTALADAVANFVQRNGYRVR